MNFADIDPTFLAATERLIAEIRQAFHDVALGDGTGLWEAQSIDDYEDEKCQSKARSRDEKLDWSRISSDDLKRCDSSLSFFDANGMRFHLPAYMIDRIQRRLLSIDRTDSAM